MNKPNLFLLGAPKCGTTSVATWLGEHHDVFLSNPKEPCYFSYAEFLPDRVSHIENTLTGYESLFSDANKSAVIAEASTNYMLHSRSVLPKILEYNPNAKFVICLREPVSMAISLYAERVFQGEEDELDFEHAWLLNDERLGMQSIPSLAHDPLLSCYHTACCLGEQVRSVFSLVNKESVFVVVLDDLKQNPLKVYMDLLEFIGVEYDGRLEFNAENKRKKRKSILLNRFMFSAGLIKKRLGITWSLGVLKKLDYWNQGGNTSLTSNRLKSDMRNSFYNDVVELGHLIDRDLIRLWAYDTNSR